MYLLNMQLISVFTNVNDDFIMPRYNVLVTNHITTFRL